jgi:hypothetical protein
VAPEPIGKAVAPPAAEPVIVQDLPALIKKIFDKQPQLAYLREARVLAWERNRLSLGFPSDFLTEKAKDERARLLPLFQAELGQALSLEFVHDAQAAAEATQRESLDAAEARAKEVERNRRRKEAVEHQALKLVRDVFGEVSFQEPELENG